jgi:hypothetical protein
VNNLCDPNTTLLTRQTVTRSARALPSDDPVEQESAVRGAKRLKTASPPAENTASDQDVEQPSPNNDAEEDWEVVQRPGSSDEETNEGYTEIGLLEEARREANGQQVDPVAPPVPTELETNVVPPPPIVPVPADAAEIENLADQILDVSIRTTAKELAAAIGDVDSDIGQEYVHLHTKLTAAKQQYSGARPFISPSDLGLSASTHVGICRRINLATFVTSLFFSSVGLEELDNYFLFTFLPRGGTLSKLAASLWIELKTQTFVAAVVGSDPRPQSAILSVLFTEDVRQRLLDARPGAEDLGQSEEEFIVDMRARQNALEADLAKTDPATLAQNFPWSDLLENIVSYLSILKLDDRKLTGSERLLLKQRQDPAQRGEEDTVTQVNGSGSNTSSHSGRVVSFMDQPGESFQHMVARCALTAIQAQGVPYFTHDGPLPYPLIRYSNELQLEEPGAEEGVTQSPAGKSNEPSPASQASIPHSSQTFPTLVLYTRAREASEIEALHPPQSETDDNSKGDRRKWSLEEEHALLEGLDRVHGPHWDQLLSDERLKARAEFELKDKARSLKLFFLKAGIEVPYYLKDASKSGSSAVAPKQEGDAVSAVSTPVEVEGA